jgi:DnaJ-class molecular chaperone
MFEDAGDSSERDAPGNVEIEIVSRPHARFIQKGNDSDLKREITSKEALAEFHRTVAGIDGGAFVGQGGTITVKGKGIDHRRRRVCRRYCHQKHRTSGAGEFQTGIASRSYSEQKN